ncbi:MAG: cation diffusion facilitator family transporter [Endomicrobium sp.]|nr:cation diffusion facilitator family transporter [Endomicrobium sp.]
MQKNETYKIVKFSVASNAVLTLGKLVAGIITGSIAIVSEAVHSLIDLVAALIAYFAVRKASQPADRIHQYGYGKFENISGTIEGLLIFAAAIYIVYRAVEKLFKPDPLDMPIIGVIIMLTSAVVNFLVSKKLFVVARENESLAAEADAWHLRTDVYTSLGVTAALVVITISKRLFPALNIYWADSLAAFIIAVMITKAAWNLVIKSAEDLFDVSLPQNEIAVVESIIKSNEDIAGFHALKTRKAGNKRFIEFHILVNSQMTVYMSHEITRDLKAGIFSKLENASVTIHVEPCDNTCTLKCQTGCLVKKRKIENIKK